MRILVVSEDGAGLDDLAGLFTIYGDCDAVEGVGKTLDLLKAALAEGRPFGFVVVDCDRACEKGPPVVAAIREWERDKSLGAVKVLLVATAEVPDAVAAATSAGADAFVAKPLQASALRPIVTGLGLGARLSLRPRGPLTGG